MSVKEFNIPTYIAFIHFKNVANLIIARTHGFAEQSFDSFQIRKKYKMYILFYYTKCYITMANRSIVINEINQNLPKRSVSYSNN